MTRAHDFGNLRERLAAQTSIDSDMGGLMYRVKNLSDLQRDPSVAAMDFYREAISVWSTVRAVRQKTAVYVETYDVSDEMVRALAIIDQIDGMMKNIVEGAVGPVA